MNMVFCNVCGVEYNALRTKHTCDPQELERIFLEEIDQPEVCGLNADELVNLKQAIKDIGSPALLVKMWKRSAGDAQSW